MIYSRMKFLLSFLSFSLLVLTCFSQVRVKGYFRKNGTYVSPHIRTSPDGILWNNFSYNGRNSSQSSGSTTIYLNKNNQLYNPNTDISSAKPEIVKVEKSQGYSSGSLVKNGTTGQLKDTVKFDNELYFQKLKRIYDKKSAPNN